MEGVEVRTVVPRIRRVDRRRRARPRSGPAISFALPHGSSSSGRPSGEPSTSSRPDVVVVPNDSLFPCAQYVDLLHRRSIPVVLLQEGVLYAFTDSAPIRPVGRGIVDAVAAWGETSAEYFRSVGMDGDRIHVTGSPRHDHVTREALRAAGKDAAGGIGRRWTTLGV